jgi:hypothetical protein
MCFFVCLCMCVCVCVCVLCVCKGVHVYACAYVYENPRTCTSACVCKCALMCICPFSIEFPYQFHFPFDQDCTQAKNFQLARHPQTWEQQQILLASGFAIVSVGYCEGVGSRGRLDVIAALERNGDNLGICTRRAAHKSTNLSKFWTTKVLFPYRISMTSSDVCRSTNVACISILPYAHCDQIPP